MLSDAKTLDSRVSDVGLDLEALLRDRGVVVSPIVSAPFRSIDGLKQEFADDTWTGEWSDVDNY
jgi:hypothetical protein